uniref:Peptidase M12A domain-containing protein n=1 Tax=Panagrolaimus davidi TaxID=227884 RepID=A0A914NYG7_9BILA
MISSKFLPLMFFLGIDTIYYTSINTEFLWTTKTVDYTLTAKNEESLSTLRDLVQKLLDQFEKDVGPVVLWNEVPWEKSSSLERYIIFELKPEPWPCGRGLPVPTGSPSTVVLSNSTNCDIYTNMAHLIEVFGMDSPHFRFDRDNFVQIHFENILEIDHQIHNKCPGCFTSENIIFKDYDYQSLLHYPKYSRYAINSSLPIITERNGKSLIRESDDPKGRKLSDIDIKILQYLFT